MEGRGRAGDGRDRVVPGYSILALLCLLLLSLSSGLSPAPEWMIMTLTAGLSVPIVAGLLRSGSHLHLLLFCAIFVNLLL